MEIEVGVVGVGNMGSGIARNLVGSGFVTAAWDLSEEVREQAAGWTSIATPEEMAAAGATILFVVPASPDIADGLDALLDAASDNVVIYDLTTSSPGETRALAARAEARGIPYLDAAMSGGATGAEAGTLSLMVGGELTVHERTRPVLEVFSNRIFHLGPVGAGHTMKLIHNMVCHTIFLATCEGGRLCESAGLRLEDMIEVFNVSNARSYASEVRFPQHILSEKWDARSRIFNLRKDVGMALQMAEELGADTSCSEATLRFLEAAVTLGMEEDDFSLLYRDFDRIREARDNQES